MPQKTKGRLLLPVEPTAELADLSLGAIADFFTEKLPDWFNLWKTDWHPGKLFVLIVTEGWIPLAEKITRTAFAWANHGPEIVGRYFDQVFAMSDDATHAEKAMTIISGATDLLMGFADTALGQGILHSVAVSSGLPPGVIDAVRGLLTEAWNEYQPFEKDYQYDVAMREEGGLEALWEQRRGAFQEYLEMADIAIPQGTVIAIEQQMQELGPVRGLSRIERLSVPAPVSEELNGKPVEIPPVAGMELVSSAKPGRGAIVGVGLLVGLAFVFALRK